MFLENCTRALLCAKLHNSFEIRKKSERKSSEKRKFIKKWDNYLCISKNLRTFAADLKKSSAKHRGVEQLVARQAHNLEVARSNPASATKVRESE